MAPITLGFSAREEQWIDEVWHAEGMQLIVQAYGELPQPVLGRVAVITDDAPHSFRDDTPHSFRDD